MRLPVFFTGILSAAAIFIAASMPVWAHDDGPIVVRHPVLAASLERLSAESPSWRKAVETVSQSGRRILVSLPDQIKIPDGKGGFMPSDPAVLAEVHPLSEDDARVETVIVVVNLDLLQALSRLPVGAADFEDDVDRIMAHEVYGHAIPILLAGNMSGNCADPAIGQSAQAACAIQRENVIRREMRLGARVDYGRESLALARRFWH